ncbi:MAG: nuclear transport factor 2 family protein [Deltaproteobacteria bacterium]|nr:nuclear transport factor 2 family protein [Deltaproteobacteria bacterium]
MTPAEAADIAEITQAIYRYASAIDQRELDLLDSIFLADATIHYNFFGLKPRAYADTKPWLEASLRIHRVTQHNMSTPRVDLAGDAARSTTYGILAHAQEKLDGAMSVLTARRVRRRVDASRTRLAHPFAAPRQSVHRGPLPRPERCASAEASRSV